MRVLHLLSRCADFETRRTSAALTDGLGAGFEIATATIGTGGTYRSVAHAAATLRRRAEELDFVHAFGISALSAAAMGTRSPIVWSPGLPLRRSHVRWLRAVMGYRNVQVISPAATQRRVLVEHGVPLNNVHLIRPGVDFSRIRRRRDPGLRAALGFSEHDRVIHAAGESTRAASHADAAWSAGILHVADPRYKLLLWGEGPRAASVARLAQRWRLPQLIAVATQRIGRVEYDALIAAADVVLVTARGAVATLPIAISMGAGLPIVSTVTYTASELLEDHHTALMAPAHKPRMLARRVLDLEDEPGLQWKIADMARTEAYEYFSTTRFLSQYRAAYQQLAAGAAIDLPAPAPGAGLRFHGRA